MSYWRNKCQVHYARASLVAQTVKNYLQCRRPRFSLQGWEDTLEKKMATHSTILACKIPWTEEPGRLQSIGSQRVGHNWATITFTSIQWSFPLLFSCKSFIVLSLMFRYVTSFWVNFYIRCKIRVQFHVLFCMWISNFSNNKNFLLKYNWRTILCLFQMH